MNEKMKKIAILAAALLMGFSAQAQSMYDAYSFGKTEYYGTARTLGMGNAVTAVGADLGSIGINPAGSAVAGYSQFTITPGITVASTVAEWAPSYTAGVGDQVFGEGSRDSRTRFILPNLGLSLRIETGNRDGLRSFTVGMVSNRTSTHLERVSAFGQDNLTSISGAFATMANFNADGNGNPLDPDIFRYDDMYGSKYFWNYIAGYDAGLINYNDDAGTYYGSGEFKAFDGVNYDYYVPGLLRKSSFTETVGHRDDILINFGLDFSDRLFLGFNLGLQAQRRRYSEFYRESADNPAAFPLTPEYHDNTGAVVVEAATNFNASTYEYNYVADVDGVYAKLGVIWLPTESLRLGAAIQTPTACTVEERWRVVINNYTDAGSTYGNSPESESSYSYRSPWGFNLGAAFTFGAYGMLSADYELSDFSVMKYSLLDNDPVAGDPFYEVNRLNKLFYGVSHALRVGLEVKPFPTFALRAGYTFQSNPERYYTDSDGYTVDAAFYDANFNFYEGGGAALAKKQYIDAPVRSLSLGLGFISDGAFFADLAVRRTTWPVTRFAPYADYLTTAYGCATDTYSPVVRSTRSLVDAVLTLGWRF